MVCSWLTDLSLAQAEKAVKKAAPSTQTIKRAPQKVKKQVRSRRCRGADIINKSICIGCSL